ncbi:MAG TPA: serine hydrolase domain-containing protein [Trebonia sp.]|jgi:CubicO group peptidase (beta-lactamase class C family)|nr:serine hydrolase domain-containing protein [Trebonia sp.]
MTSAVERLLALGREGTHPASAIAGVRTAAGTTVAAGGWAQLPGAGLPGQSMTRQALLDLASVTKVAATTTLFMRLVADGQVTLQAPAHRFLPSFTGAGKDDITLEQLLTHTAGLPPWWPLYCEARDRDAALERAQQLPLASRPGTAWCYSDLGLILAGRIVERVTTLGLADAFRRLVAEPLGLAARYGPVPAAAAAASADSDAYELGMVATGRPYPVPFTAGQFPGWRNRPLRGEVHDGNAAHALGGVAGHAGLFATVDDLLLLGAAVRGGDFIPSPVLARFAAPVPVHPEQAVGLRRGRAQAGGIVLTLLYHGGFTGTYFAFGLEDELVVAGGAMRLYGTLGPLPADGLHPDVSHLVAGTDIQSVLLDAATAAFGHAAAHATPAEEP